MDMRLVGARDGQANRLGSGRKQQPVVGNPASIREHDLAGTRRRCQLHVVSRRRSMSFFE